jgi:hypothetical protein
MNPIEFSLPSGKSASIRPATGRDLVQAEQIASKDAGSLEKHVALLSRITVIDGHVLPFEDFQDLSEDDIEVLTEKKASFSKTRSSPPAPPQTECLP